MRTSQYPPDTRAQMKRDQRSFGYQELRRRFTEQRTQLEDKLRARNETIELLKKKLVAAGFPADEIDKLAA